MCIRDRDQYEDLEKLIDYVTNNLPVSYELKQQVLEAEAVSYTHLGAKGQATEIQIAAENILKTKKRLNEILAANTGKPYETIAADTERDNYMSAQEAAEYGLIDSVITNR